MIVCSLIFVLCFFFVSLDSSLIKLEPILTLCFLSDWSLNFIIFIMVLLHYIQVNYITKLHDNRLFISYKYIIIHLILFTFFLYYFHCWFLCVAFCKSTSDIPASVPHPTSHIPNIPHPKHPTSWTSHILNISHPQDPTCAICHFHSIPHFQHPTSRQTNHIARITWNRIQYLSWYLQARKSYK